MKRFTCTLAQGSRGALAAQRLLPVRLVASPLPRPLATFAAGLTTGGATLADAPPDTAPTLTAADVAKWTPEQLVDHLQSHSFLEPPDFEVLKKNNISGRLLLGLDSSSSWTRELGISVGGCIHLMDFVTPIRTGGPKTKTVRILDDGEETEMSFDTQDALRDFLRDQGAMSLQNGDGKTVRTLAALKPAGVYTIEFVKASLQSTQRASSRPS